MNDISYGGPSARGMMQERDPAERGGRAPGGGGMMPSHRGAPAPEQHVLPPEGIASASHHAAPEPVSAHRVAPDPEPAASHAAEHDGGGAAAGGTPIVAAAEEN